MIRYLTASLYDVAPGLRRVRFVLVALLLWTSMLTNGAEHGLYYAKPEQPFGDGVGIHETDLVQEWAYYGLAAASGLPLVSCVGLALAGRTLFQGPINVSTGHAWLGPESESAAFFGVEVPKVFTGWGRLLQMVLGLALAGLPYVLQVSTQRARSRDDHRPGAMEATEEPHTNRPEP